MVEQYQELLQLLKQDVQAMMAEGDYKKRAPKVIMEYLKMIKVCEQHIDEASEDGWAMLSESARARIEQILDEELDYVEQGDPSD